MKRCVDITASETVIHTRRHNVTAIITATTVVAAATAAGGAAAAKEEYIRVLLVDSAWFSSAGRETDAVKDAVEFFVLIPYQWSQWGSRRN